MATPFRIPETPDYAGFARQNAMLDLSPINNAIGGWQQQEQRNVENKRAEDQLGMQRTRLGMEQEKFGEDKAQKVRERAGNLALLTLQDGDPNRRAQRWQQFLQSHPDAKNLDPKYHDPNVGPMAVLADAGMSQQYLDYQMRKAAEGRASAADSRAAAMHGPQLQTAQIQARTAERDFNTPKPNTFDLGPDHTRFMVSPGPDGKPVAQEFAQGKPKPMNLGYESINKMSEEGGKFSTVSGLANSFNDKYSGYIVGGDTAMAGTRLGLPIASQDAAQWWQTYDRHKNVVRNELFGAALTPSEQAQFDKADITPNMNPAIVKRNLAVQKQIIQAAAKRKVEALVAAGANPDVVQKAYGFDPRGAASPGGGAGGANDPLGIR